MGEERGVEEGRGEGIMVTDINILQQLLHWRAQPTTDPRSSPALQVDPFFQSFPFVPSCHLHPVGKGEGFACITALRRN